MGALGAIQTSMAEPVLPRRLRSEWPGGQMLSTARSSRLCWNRDSEKESFPASLQIRVIRSQLCTSQKLRIGQSHKLGIGQWYKLKQVVIATNTLQYSQLQMQNVTGKVGSPLATEIGRILCRILYRI